MNVLEKILEEIKDHTIEFEYFGLRDKYVSVGWVKEIIRSHMDDIPDTNVGGDNDTEEKIRVHIAECLHRIDNIRSFVGSKEHVNNDEKCIRNIEINEFIEVVPDTLCQYTGLTDKNIWENDIVRNEKGDIGVVQWFEEHVAFMIWNKTKNCVCYLAENDFSKIEVIGNIFDNADLLEVE